MHTLKLSFPLAFGLCIVALEALFALCIFSAAPVGSRWLGDTIQNSSDIAVYFSYMRQGADGALLLADRYAVEPAARRFDPLWSSAGMLARSGISFILLHEMLRWIFTIALSYAVFSAAYELARKKQDAALATILVFGGVGFGWAYSLWLQANHAWSPLTYAAADVVTEFGVTPILIGGVHMIMSLALLITGLRLTWRAWQRQQMRDGLWATATLGALSSFHPYFGLLAAVFSILCVVRFRKSISHKIFCIGAALAVVAAIPTLLIYLPLAFDPVFRTHQLVVNVLPLPPVLSWVCTLFPFVIAGAWRWKNKKKIESSEEWLIAWLVAAAVCMLLPVPWTRKYLEGIGPVLVLLTLPAWLALRDWVMMQRPKVMSRLLGAMLLLAACLTPLHLFASQLAWVAPDPAKQKWFYTSAEQFAAWEWVRSNTPPQDIVVSDDMWVNLWTPAYADRTVWLGHDHETPDFWAKDMLWNELMHTTDGARAAEILDTTPVNDLLLTTTTTQATFPGWLAPDWQTVYHDQRILILERHR